MDKLCVSRGSFKLQPLTASSHFTSPLGPPRNSAHFSTSRTLLVDGGFRQTRSVRIKKKIPSKGYKIPAPGERKAIRKRVVLSNSNALEVSGLKDWPTALSMGAARGIAGFGTSNSRKSRADEHGLLEGEDPGSISVPIGSVVALPNDTVDGLRALDSFKSSQGWSLFRRPSCLVREATAEVVKGVEQAERAGLSGSDSPALAQRFFRRLIVGARGTGKSVLLLQAQAVALARGWVTIHIPEAQDLTTATTAYSPLHNTNPQKYTQKDYTAALLSRIAKANASVLSQLTLVLEHRDFPIPLQSNMTLDRLAQLGASGPEISWQVFNALWAELTVDNSHPQISQPPAAGSRAAKEGKQRQDRPPILLTLDSLAHASRLSEYLAQSMHYIHAHDLALLDHFFGCLGGTIRMPNGGAVIAADSNSNRPASPSLDLAIRLAGSSASSAAAASTAPSASQKGVAKTDPLTYDPESPYEARDPRVLAALRGVPIIRLQGFSRDEIRAVMEYYAKSGMMPERVTDGFVNESWCLSGGGVVKELERIAMRD